MKKIFPILLAASILAVSCREKEPEFLTTDKGPTQSVTYDDSALMGSELNFSVNLTDEYALSTLKVKLLFDDAVVADTTIRTKEFGTYEGKLMVPFYKNIPDGVATLRVTSQNIRFGLTEQEFSVSVSRPDFEYLTLVGEGGETYRMEKVSRNNYAVTDLFPSEMNATIITAPFDAAGRRITFGFSANQGITNTASGLIPFQGVGSPYEISFNTLTFEGAPFIELKIAGTQANMVAKDTYAAVVNLEQGSTFDVTGIDLSGWGIDPDFLEEVETGTYKFLATSGLYKVTVLLADQYFLIERMSDPESYANIDSHAIWMIGDANNYGKPAMFSAGWNTDFGLCFAEVEDNVYQLTLEAGTQLAMNSFNVKIFHQKGWGGEFGGGSYASVEDGGFLTVGESDGNIHLAAGKVLDFGGLYRFTVDLTGGLDAADLRFEKVGQNEVVVDEIAFAGVTAELAGVNLYTAVASLNQGQEVTVTGIADIADYTADVDFLETVSPGRYTVIPVDGYYKATIDQTSKFIGVERVDDAGAPVALNTEDGTGAIWMIGDANNYGKPVMFTAGWNTNNALCFAEVQPHVFQLTLEAGSQLATTGFNVKLFHQKGWGGEFGGGSYASVEDGGLLSVGESDGNIHLASGKTLEIGAPYRFTVDLTGGLSGAVLKFEKAGESTIVADDVAINGVKADLAGVDVYAATVALAKDEEITITGVSNVDSFWWDPDFFPGGKFGAVDGKYKVTVNKVDGTVLARRVNDDDSAPNLEQGGLYIQGWGVAAVRMTGQVGWPGTGGYQMAQVSEGVFQLTGLAVAETDDTIGGRFRTDYWSLKWFFQDGWGGEASKGVTISGNAAESLTQGDDGNIGLAANLEEGATYRLTVDFTGCTISGSSITGVESVSFDKL